MCPQRLNRPDRARIQARRRTAALLSALLATVALLAACTTPLAGHGTPTTPPTSATPSATPSANAPLIKLSDCSKLLNTSGIPASRLRHLTFKCGKVTVPLDYAAPSGPRIDLQVLRVHDDQQVDPIGSLLINPGGPGGTGLNWPIALAGAVSNDVLMSYDLVGFDPRGVGLSSPVKCLSNDQKDALNDMDPDARTPEGFAQAKEAATTVAQECSAQYGPSLADYNTVYTAMDLDQIRLAMGDSKLNYLGFSYGTELGWTYAHLYPAKVGAFVLDGAVDPAADYVTRLGNQLGGFEGAFDQFATDCQTKVSCNKLTDPRAVVTALVAQANTKPLTSTHDNKTRVATGGIILTAVISALYVQGDWPVLASALLDAEKGDPDGLFSLADSYNERDSEGGYSNLYEAYTAISCNDLASGPSDATIKATTVKWAAQYPLFGLWGALQLFACPPWQPIRHAVPSPTAVAAPIVVVGTIHDPATPYAGAQHLAAALKATLLTWDGQGHTAYLRGSSCVDDAVDSYLVDGTLPPMDTVCPA